jgi:hypothetical protein
LPLFKRKFSKMYFDAVFHQIREQKLLLFISVSFNNFNRTFRIAFCFCLHVTQINDPWKGVGFSSFKNTFWNCYNKECCPLASLLILGCICFTLNYIYSNLIWLRKTGKLYIVNNQKRWLCTITKTLPVMLKLTPNLETTVVSLIIV